MEGRSSLRFWFLPTALVAACALVGPASASATYQFAQAWGSVGSGDGQFNGPVGIASDAGGSVFVADLFNSRIQKFTSGGAFLTKWGIPGSGDGEFNFVVGVAANAGGSVFVTDCNNHRVQKFSSDGAFIAKWGTNGSGDGQFSCPYGVATDAGGSVFVTDPDNNRVQKFNSSGAFITKWGTAGSGDGQFNNPEGVATDGAGNVYVADTFNDRIQKFSSDGAFIAKWGTSGSANGQFNHPRGIDTDAAGSVYVADTDNHRVQKFSSSGAFIAKWGTFGPDDGQLDFPSGIATDAAGSVYVADTSNNRIQKFAAVAPDTRIDSAPEGLVSDSTPSFSFSSVPGGAGFECRVKGSGSGFEPCTSPHTTGELEDGLNIFVVRAVDSDGIPDPTPAEAEFRLDATAPQTYIDSGPKKKTRKRKATFAFSSSERNGSPPFRCALDGASFNDCDSPHPTAKLAFGKHTFQVKAVDRAGNDDQTPARRSFVVVR